MSEDLFYNRDNNITGSLAYMGEYSGVPIKYGASVSFKGRNNIYETDNKYINVIPMSINNLTVEFKFTHETSPDIIQGVASKIEDSKGTTPISFVFDTGMFSPNSGYALRYSNQQIHRFHGLLSTDIEVTDYSPDLQWSGRNILSQNWSGYSDGESYTTHDVSYMANNNVKLNNFYYCTGDHTATEANSPTGVESMWTQDFWFFPDEGLSTSVEFSNTSLDWKNSMKSRIKIKNNIATLQPIRYSFSNRSQSETYAILHFLENKAGHRKFRVSLKTIYDAPKVVYSTQWDTTINHFNDYSTSIELTEDPLGIIPIET